MMLEDHSCPDESFVVCFVCWISLFFSLVDDWLSVAQTGFSCQNTLFALVS